jgi:hypothetical protein
MGGGTLARVSPLGLLFLFFAACFAGLAYAAARAGGGAGWVVAVAAAALTLWFGQSAFRLLFPRS